MSKLVDELIKDHVFVAETLEKISKAGIASPAGKELAGAAKKALLAHLKKEDDQLYPPLKKAASANKGLQSILDSFAKDMDEITKFAFDFFGKIENPATDSIELSRDFGKLTTLLKTRVRREETHLYPEFDKLK